MIALLAAVGAITIVVLLWRVLGAERIRVPQRRPPLAPDDDPDFLRKLSEQQRDRGPDEES
ncbi:MULTISPECIES: hypothetical protein [Amycolatopsis]|uniref:Uncharacterized protein n=2 Tax=Amycolatopsis TaxID=1813 RepID=A0A2A9F9Z5_9PSEU|nr:MULTISPECIES: hypothetical protein [Amycolatopsis]PFG47773.1 hypothetical protein ATK36_2827 [Amycolatopsis sulphurea]RJQ84088.1 hypothetical protein D5S19_18240 [Amycolatopsis panacis]